jgi:hypothetical protein
MESYAMIDKTPADSMGVALMGDFPFYCRRRKRQQMEQEVDLNLYALRGLDALEQPVPEDIEGQLARLDAKTDLLLAHQIDAQRKHPPLTPTLMRLYPNGVYWYGEADYDVSDVLEVWLQLHPLTPPLYFSGWIEIVDTDAYLISFAGLDPEIEELLSQHIFRHHRRRVRAQKQQAERA